MAKIMKKILTAVLSLAVIACFVPQMGMQVYAEDESSIPAMVPGTKSALKDTANTDSAQTVYYGKDENGDPIAWRVIGYDGSGAASKSGAVTLLSAKNLAQTSFYEDSQDGNAYAGSLLEGKVNGIADTFSSKEKNTIEKRTLEHGVFNEAAPRNTDCIAGEEDLTNVILWPLSTKEANDVNRNLRIADPDHPLWSSNFWWLRSPGAYYYLTAAVDGNGTVLYDGCNISADIFGVRPAFYLNLSSVLFTSAAEDGKSDTTGGLTAVGDNSIGEWKLTLLDDGSGNAVGNGHAGFSVDTAQIEFNGAERTATIPYSGATATANDYISAIITDAPFTDEDSNIKYYGKIAKASGEDGATVKVNIADMEEDDHLYIFNEECNGDKETDFAGALTEITVPELISYTVTFKVQNGSWDDGTKTDKKVTLSRYENEDLLLKLDESDIPAVGSKPDSGYKKGAWDVTPDTDKAVTEDMTYTYTYAKGADDVLLAKMTAEGKTSLVLTWNKVSGAKGYDIFFVNCGKNKVKLVKTIKGNKTFKWTKKGLKKKTAYKAVVKAYVMKNGKKSYIKASPMVHAYTSGGSKNYTNPKSVTVKKTDVSLNTGNTFKIKATVTKLQKGKKLMPASHAPKLRYISSNKKIATVSKSGKVTAKAKGSCTIYVIAVNGAYKAVKVTVE